MMTAEEPLTLPKEYVTTGIVVIVLLFSAATVLLMVKDYRRYLEEHREERYSLAHFIRQEQLYLYLLLFFLLVAGIECLR